MSAIGDKANIKVVVRIKPISDQDRNDKNVAALTKTASSLEIRRNGQTFSCAYDDILSNSDSVNSQMAMFGKISPCIDEFLSSAINLSVLTYGATGSGKTYTMFGPAQSGGRIDRSTRESSHGIIPRTLCQIFERLQSNNSNLKRVSMRCSMLQVYNEQVYDLFRDPMLTKPLAIRENALGETIIAGLSECGVFSLDDCYDLLDISEENRLVRDTRSNHVSSRSHSIFKLTLDQDLLIDGLESRVTSRLCMVDLAGSERWDDENTVAEEHVSEMTSINLSLHTLGRCIFSLAKRTKDSTRVPFRDSKLTRILQDSLQGKARTILVATISQSNHDIDNTISTLKFADCAKRVMIRVPTVNIVSVESSVELQKLKREVQELRSTRSSCMTLLSDLISATVEDSWFASLGDSTKQLMNEYLSSGTIEIAAKLAQDFCVPKCQKSDNIGTKVVSFALNKVIESKGSRQCDDVKAVEELPVETVATDDSAEKLEELKGSFKKLNDSFTQMKNCANMFFTYMIEEDEFRSSFQRIVEKSSTIESKIEVSEIKIVKREVVDKKEATADVKVAQLSKFTLSAVRNDDEDMSLSERLPPVRKNPHGRKRRSLTSFPDASESASYLSKSQSASKVSSMKVEEDWVQNQLKAVTVQKEKHDKMLKWMEEKEAKNKLIVDERAHRFAMIAEESRERDKERKLKSLNQKEKIRKYYDSIRQSLAPIMCENDLVYKEDHDSSPFASLRSTRSVSDDSTIYVSPRISISSVESNDYDKCLQKARQSSNISPL